MKGSNEDEANRTTVALGENPVIDMAQCLALTKHKPQALEKLIAILLESFLVYKAEFRSLLTKKDILALGQLVHKSKMGIDLVAARSLDAAISKGRRLAEGSNVGEMHLEEAIQGIETEFDKVIAEFRQLVK